MNSEFTVKINTFEGPFSLLLDLIEKHKLSINEVSLSSVTEEYIDYVKNLDEYSMNDISSFIVVAATLMLIKSRSLIPNLSVTEEENSEIEKLTKRIETFQVVKAISGFVKSQYGKSFLFIRPYIKIKRKVFSPSGQMTKSEIYNQIINAIDSIPKEVLTPETKVKRSIRIEDVISSLFERVQKEASFTFKEFAKKGVQGNAREIKTFIVVSFLAMLELVKNGTLDANQDSVFGEITIGK